MSAPLLNAGYTAACATARLARDDVNTFCEFTLRDDETKKPIRQARIHEMWHKAIAENDKTGIWSFVESGKSMQIAVAEPVWRLGNDPTLRVVVVGSTFGPASKRLAAIGKLILNKRTRQVFPHLRPGKPWNSENLSIIGGGTAIDPSVQAIGLHGNLLGSRTDLVVLDDILTQENTQTEAQMKDTIDWLTKTLFGRLTKRAKILWIGNAWNPNDAMHFFSSQPDWFFMRTPVIGDGTPGNPLGVLAWPEQWDEARIAKKKVELVVTEEFQRQMMAVARDDKTSRFKEAWIARCKANGEGHTMAYQLEYVPEGYRVYTGVDLGVKAVRRGGKKSDMTVLFTILVHPNGRREVLWIDAGRWSSPEIVRRIIETQKNFNSVVVVENNAAQDYIVQFVQDKETFPIVGFNTGSNKADPHFGVESIALEMAQGHWIIPSRNGIVDPEVEEWINNMLFYAPDKHVGDRLMACWFAREASRINKVMPHTGRLTVGAHGR